VHAATVYTGGGAWVIGLGYLQEARPSTSFFNFTFPHSNKSFVYAMPHLGEEATEILLTITEISSISSAQTQYSASFCSCAVYLF
jgi:hypothetical protein